ncbi:deaminase [Patescibacteria group bacterium]|jgi:dCMP deaminase|nr:deaminase [Patescibacteria group bacterium]
MKALVCYIPVLHEGYRRLFERHPDAKELYLFGPDVIASFEYLVKDIRKLDPALVKKAVESWGMFDAIHLLDETTIKKLQDKKTSIIVSDDELTESLVEKYFSGNPVEKDTIFLRWGIKKSIEPTAVVSDITISEDEFDCKMIEVALEEGAKAKDWWRRIGALAVKDGAVILQAHNLYVPSDQTPYDEGDPRSNFTGGKHFESSLAIHAEAQLVAQAAKEGISLKGADVYCDTFPCPPCAKQLAYSGIKRVYYRNGYSVLDGERILKSQGVEIIFVK